MDAPREPARLLIVWWSNTGGTERLVRAAAEGARAACADTPDALELFSCRCDAVPLQALLAADALLFASPECLGTVAGPMKTFFDRCYYPALDGLVGRPYATLVCAGTDGEGATRQIDRIATGWRLRRVAEPVRVITGAQAPAAILSPKDLDAPRFAGDLARAVELGATLAAGTCLGLW
jgi:multimeric flavodoxin WrbA